MIEVNPVRTLRKEVREFINFYRDFFSRDSFGVEDIPEDELEGIHMNLAFDGCPDPCDREVLPRYASRNREGGELL